MTARDPQTPMDGLGHAVAVLDVKPVGEEDLGLLIGRHGAHVAALQYVVNVIVSRALDGNNPVTVDVDSYIGDAAKQRSRRWRSALPRKCEIAGRTGHPGSDAGG